MNVKILSRSDLEKLLTLPAVLAAVRNVYRLKASGETAVWPLVGYDFEELNAVSDIRAGVVFGDVQMHGGKLLNNFPNNRDKGLAPFTGILMVFDSTTGHPVGIMDASYITSMRTGASGAIGVDTLARRDAKTLLILGAGKQAIFQIAATLSLRPGIKTVYIADELDKDNEKTFAESCKERIQMQFVMDVSDVEFLPAISLEEAVGKSDAIITMTPARSPAILKDWVKSGTHFSCVGADMPGKEEIDPEIFRAARVYADDLEQCTRVGEMEIPIAKGIITKDNIVGEIGEVLSNRVPGRVSDEDITIYDTTGLALTDLVTAKIAIELSKEMNCGVTAEL